MKKVKLATLLVAAVSLSTFSLSAQKVEYALKIGSSFYIDCRHTILYKGVDVMSLADIENKGAKVNFHIYSPAGVLEASVKAGKLSGNAAASFAVVSSADKFTVTDKRDGRIVCMVQKKWNNRAERWDLLVWADLYMPDGNIFQCTPETTNVPLLQMMQGSTFTGAFAAIQLD